MYAVPILRLSVALVQLITASDRLLSGMTFVMERNWCPPDLEVFKLVSDVFQLHVARIY